MTTLEIIDYLRNFERGQMITMTDTQKLAEICDLLQKRISTGRPKKFASAQERWAYHNNKRREMKKTEQAIDIADEVL